MEYVILLTGMGMIVGVAATLLVAKFFIDALPEVDELLWDDVEWDEPDEDAKLRPLVGVVHPNKKDLL